MKDKFPFIFYFCITEQIKAIPLRLNSKVPIIKGWNSCKHIPLPEIKEKYYSHNIGFVCGSPSNGLWVIDCDSETTLIEIENLLSKYSIKTFEVKTRRGKHFYFQSPQKIITTKSLGIDIKGENSYVVAPYSTIDNFTYKYTQKTVYKLYPLGKDAYFIKDLETIIKKPITIVQKISQKAYNRINKTNIDTSTSEQEFNIILEMISKKINKNTIFKTVLNIHKDSHIHRINNQKEYLEKTYKKAYAIHIKNMEKEKKIEAENIEAAILQKNLRGVEKNILWLLTKKAKGKKNAKLSYREIIKNGAIGSHKTIKKALNELINKELINKTGESIYSISYDKILNNTPISSTTFFRTSSLDIASLLRKKSDNIPIMFSHGYLGFNTFFIFNIVLRYFSASIFSAKKISCFFSISHASLYRILKKCCFYNFFDKVSGGYKLSPLFIQKLLEYHSSLSLDILQKKREEKVLKERAHYQFQNVLYMAYKRKHITYEDYKKIPLAMYLLGLDLSDIYLLLQAQKVA